MTKTEAIELLGGTVSAAAKVIGISYQAVDKWPDDLPDRLVDRVQAALWRMSKHGSAETNANKGHVATESVAGA